MSTTENAPEQQNESAKQTTEDQPSKSLCGYVERRKVRDAGRLQTATRACLLWPLPQLFRLAAIDKKKCSNIESMNSSCSVACNKTHRENHPPDPEPKPEPPQAAAPPTAPTEAAKAATNASEDTRNPFRALDFASDKLQMLFTKYPGLPRQLMDIHAAMQPPSEADQNNGIPASLLKGLPSKKDAWNHDIGIKNGKEALRKARKAHGAPGEGVREYCELIRYLMNGQAGAEASALLQKQAATQDSELIERLMTEEKRR
ncbi:hypothetical protein NLG97_g6929 [Lecanicillium saksenae]|uniref:Uncharacterized protein n=1 Tax=Lecanicillium saksenae TaxID=468837 RepID=A0ACC1QPV7_9HYPO|nr:hypothetical protein NLG97_g6929 [Lecanicillium saksenae]